MATPDGTAADARQAATGYALRAPPFSACRVLKDLHHFLGHEPCSRFPALHGPPPRPRVGAFGVLGLASSLLSRHLGFKPGQAALTSFGWRALDVEGGLQSGTEWSRPGHRACLPTCGSLLWRPKRTAAVGAAADGRCSAPG